MHIAFRMAIPSRRLWRLFRVDGKCCPMWMGVVLLLAVVLLPSTTLCKGRKTAQPKHSQSTLPWNFPPVPGLKQQFVHYGIFPNMGSHNRHTGTQLSPSFLAWQRLKSKLNAGQPITAFGIGSSVLGVHGGCTGPPPAFASVCDVCCYPQLQADKASMRGNTAAFGAGWARIGFDFLVRSGVFSDSPDLANKSRLLNYARPGGGQDVYNRCLSKYAPGIENADLVLIEFNVIAQDAQPTDNMMPAKETEGVLRQLLQFETRPAIMIVNMFNWCKDVPALCGPPHVSNPAGLSDLSRMFTGSGTRDKQFRQLGKHYEIPVLSHLAALWHLFFPDTDPSGSSAAEDRPGLTHSPALLRTAAAEGLPHPRQGLTIDGIHPTENGNAVFGPMLALAFSQVLAGVGRAPSAASEATAVSLPDNVSPLSTAPIAPIPLEPDPIFASNETRIASTGLCFDFIRPVFPENEDGAMTATTTISDDLERLEVGKKNGIHILGPIMYANPAEILESRGFGYEEIVTTHDGKERWKPGISGNSSGAFVLLSYAPPPSHYSVNGGRPNACLTYMESGRAMGRARVTCGGACACEHVDIDAHAPNFEHTIERTVCHPMQMGPQDDGILGSSSSVAMGSANCTVRVELLPESASEDQRYFKITSLSFHAHSVECPHGIC